MIINVNGRLGRNAEEVQTKNGTSFVKYSVAIDEYDYATKANVTTWLNVTDNTERTKKTLQYLTKGSLINLIGNYKANIFNGQNGPSISHDVRCLEWSFINAGKNENSSAANSANNASMETPTIVTAPKVSVTPDVAPTTGSFKQPSVVAATTASVDDLPF